MPQNDLILSLPASTGVGYYVTAVVVDENNQVIREHTQAWDYVGVATRG